MAIALQQPELDPGKGSKAEEQRRLIQQQKAQRARDKQALSLQRENILSQRTSSPARRTALEAALKQIEGQIESLG